MVAPNHLWTPNQPAQADFFNDWTHRYPAYAGGWGCGKSYVGSRKLVCAHIRNAFDKFHRYTGISSLIVAPTYGDAEAYIRPAIEDAMREAGLQFKWKPSYDEYLYLLPQLDAPNRPSMIRIRSARQPERITGFECGYIWC